MKTKLAENRERSTGSVATDCCADPREDFATWLDPARCAERRLAELRDQFLRLAASLDEMAEADDERDGSGDFMAGAHGAMMEAARLTKIGIDQAAVAIETEREITLPAIRSAEALARRIEERRVSGRHNARADGSPAGDSSPAPCYRLPDSPETDEPNLNE